MSTRERILTIRLMEKIEANPGYGQLFGVEVTLCEINHNWKEEK